MRGGVDAGRAQQIFGGGEMVAGDGLVGEDGAARIRPQRLDAGAEMDEQAAPDNDLIGARAERDRHHDRFIGAQGRGHDDASGLTSELAPTPRWPANAAMISPTMTSCASSRDFTTISASA